MTCGAVTNHHAFDQPWSMTVQCEEEGDHDMHKGYGWGGKEMFMVFWPNPICELSKVGA